MSIAFELTSQQQGREILAALGERFPTTAAAAERRRMVAYDTFDWRLWKAGLELDVERRGRTWMAECRGSGAPPRGERLRSEPGFAADLPPGRLREALAPILGPRRLLPRIELACSRAEVRVLDRREKTVARVRLETVRTRSPGRRAYTELPPRLEAVPVKGFDRHLAEVRAFLESRGLAREERTPRHRAYEACGIEPGGYRPSVEVPLDPSEPVHLAMRRIHAHLLDIVRANEEGLRADLDIEFLHDFRVAVRRTRAALTQVKGVYPPRRARRFRKEFAWLGGLTGTLRDLDVYRLKLDDYRAALPADAAADLTPLEGLIERRQRREHARVVRGLDTARCRRLLDSWERFLADEEPPGLPPTALRPVAEVARERILGAHAKLIRKGRAIGPDTPDAKLHRLRIDGKKLRYLLEFFRGLYRPREIARAIKALKGLQENLGDFNDLSVQQEALRDFGDELAASGNGAETLMALGQLIAVLAQRQREQRRDFHDRFARFDRRRVKRRLVRMLDGARP